MKKAANVLRGRVAKAAGDQFESWIESQHNEARLLGILAHVEHNEPHGKFIRGRIKYVSPGVADYTGTLDRCGLSLAVEAKSRADDRLPKSAVTSEQQEHLNAVAHAGGLALLLVEFRTMTPPYRQRYAVPWLQIPWTVLRTAESVGPEQIAEWIIAPFGTNYLTRFHSPGQPSTPPKRRTYPRE